MILKHIARSWISLVRRFRLRRIFAISFLTDLLIYYRFHGHLPKRNSFFIPDLGFWNKAVRDAVALGPFTDKEIAKYFVAGIVGHDKVPKTYAVLRTIDELRKFNCDTPYIAKPTHASGGVVAKPWGGKLTDEEVANLKGSLDSNYFLHGGEHHYRKLEPKILIEEYLTPNEGVPPDYKFTYYRGECLYVTVDFDRFGSHRRAQYSQYWQRLDMMWDIPNMDDDVPRPRQLDEILAATRKIAKLFEFCRVDCFVERRLTSVHQRGWIPSLGRVVAEMRFPEAARVLRLERRHVPLLHDQRPHGVVGEPGHGLGPGDLRGAAFRRSCATRLRPTRSRQASHRTRPRRTRSGRRSGGPRSSG